MNGTILRFYVHENRVHRHVALFEWLLEQAKKVGIHGDKFFPGLRMRHACHSFANQKQIRPSNRLVIQTAEVVVLRKRLDSAPHTIERGFKWLPREMQPGQPQVIGVAKLGSPETAGVERLQKFVVA